MIDKEIDPNSPGTFDNVKVNSNAIARPKLTFFYEKKNGEIFAAEEPEAANGKYWKKFNYVGWSNGKTYLDTINAAKLKKNQIISKEDASVLLQKAFDAELKVAKQNMKEARDLNRPAPRPRRIEWYFDSSVPEQDRIALSGGNYGKATNGSSI